MIHSDHVRLLRDGISRTGGVWADLGSGEGAFTLALADLIGPQGRIISIDKNSGALQAQRQAMQAHFPDNQVEYRQADFTHSLDLPPLDGVVMANSLHFQRQKDPVLKQLLGSLTPGGRLLLVEYNTDQGNPWVPYPLSYAAWEALAARSGFINTRRLATYPSRFLREIYSAVSFKAV